jgi:uncharacterized protein (TIGR02001 family)
MKKLLVAVLASIAVFALPVTASIAAVNSANVALTSNYVFRGQTQTDDGAAIQGGYDIKQSKDDLGWYAGVFASNVDNNNGDGLEIDLYGGWRGAFGKQNNLGYDVGAIYYSYTDSNFSPDVTEVYAGVNYETAYLKIFFGDTSGGGSHNYIDIGASFVVLKDLDLDLHYGRFSSSNTDYNDISAALSMDIKGYDLSLRVTYEDEGAKDDVEFFVTVGKRFDF